VGSAVRNPTSCSLQISVAPRHRQQYCPKRGPEWISQSQNKKENTAPRAAENDNWNTKIEHERT
jgi:hypothetical protein